MGKSLRMTNEEYHGMRNKPYLSRGVIQTLLSNPYRAWYEHPCLNPEYQPEAKEDKYDIGTAAHELLLEGLDSISVIEADDWRKKEAKEARDAARAVGRIPLLSAQSTRVKDMVTVAEGFLAHCELGITDLRGTGGSELSLIWEEDGIHLKVRPDWLRWDSRLVVDYKTTGASAEPSAFARSIIDHGYDIQWALYRRGVKAVTGVEPDFFFLVQETYPPYLCSLVSLPPMWQQMANEKVEYGIWLWRECLKTGIWPGYPDRIAYVDPPGWALAQWESRAAEIGYGGGEGNELHI